MLRIDELHQLDIKRAFFRGYRMGYTQACVDGVPFEVGPEVDPRESWNKYKKEQDASKD